MKTIIRKARELDPVLGVMSDAIFRAGEQIKCLPRAFESKPGEGHRSGTTAGDNLAQKTIIDGITKGIPGVKIICEEDSIHPAVLSKHDPRGIFNGVATVIDPVDSTLHYSEDTGGWSITGGKMVDGRLCGSAIYAPGINGGLFIVAKTGGGVWTMEWAGELCSHLPSNTCRPAKKSVVRLGVDTLLYPSFTEIVPQIAANVKGVLTTGSGVLGLGLLACGRTQAVIQTPQKVWDWAGAYCAVIESGNIFLFFRILDDGTLVAVQDYDYESFCFLPKRNRLGFVAGQPDLADRLWKMLPKSGWSRVNPDTVSGTW